MSRSMMRVCKTN